MSSVKKVNKNEYDVVITVSREQARMIHKLVGAFSTHGFSKDLHYQLTEVLGSYSGAWLDPGEMIGAHNVNAGYEEP